MIIEEIKEPCEECVHEARCTIKHPELMVELPEEERTLMCDKLNKFSSYIDATRANF